MKGMEFEQWKKSMESDATIENKKLKKKIEELEKEVKDLKETNNFLEDDCRVLANRCHVYNGLNKFFCIRCCLSEYQCPHRPSFNEEEQMIHDVLMNDPEFQKTAAYQAMKISEERQKQKRRNKK